MTNSPRSSTGGSIFKSAQDGWLIAVLMIPLSGAALLALSSVGWSSDWSGMVVATLVVLPVLLSFSAWWVLTEYALINDALLVRCGPVNWRIGYAEIRQVKPVWSLRIAPALAIRRLRVDFGSDERLMVSPLQRDRFLVLLEAYCAHLRREGDALVAKH